VDSHTILAIETTIEMGSLALCREGEIVASRSGSEIVSWSSHLIPAIEAMYRDFGISLNETDLIAVSCGPGSFTGIRVGLATAKALKKGLGCILCGISSLELLAEAAPFDGQIAIGIDAGREHVFFQTFSKNAAKIETLSAPQLLSYELLRSEFRDDRTKFVVNSALDAKLRDEKVGLDAHRIVVVTENLAAYLAKSAMKKMASGNVVSPEPLYLRGALR